MPLQQARAARIRNSRHGVMSLTGTGFVIDESSDKTVAEQLREALSKAAVRVGDLFRDYVKSC